MDGCLRILFLVTRLGGGGAERQLAALAKGSQGVVMT